MPYENEFFDSVVSTMAFSGYPDADKAMAEMQRVLKPEGRLIVLDINFPREEGYVGMGLARLWQSSGDLLRDMDALFQRQNLDYTDEEVGGFGTVHLYIAQKRR